jgi:FkbM family methyltransferase
MAHCGISLSCRFLLQIDAFRVLARSFHVFGLTLLKRRSYLELQQKAFPTALVLCKRFRVNIGSVLHVGSHSGDEALEYWDLGIRDATFIEASTEVFHRLLSNLNQFPTFIGINACLSDSFNEVEFNVASNDGASSSILKPARHNDERPDILFNSIVPIQTVTLDSLKLRNFDLVVIDVQGAEAKVITGGWNTIQQAKALYLECNVGNMYEGDISLNELVMLLKETFDLVFVDMCEARWGDCLFLNKKMTNRI